MSPPIRSHMPTAVLVDGLAAAVDRVRAADLAAPAGFHAVFEALAWVGAIQDRLVGESRPVPATIKGLYYVRNLAIHAGADVVSLIIRTYGSGAYGSGPYGGGPTHVFPVRGDLPPPRGKQPQGIGEYDSHVAEQDVLDVLERAAAEAAGAQSGAQDD